ncbi:hypothetical protein [Levilactobacillus fujinensis]|uniref:hypothetical protein n=1 Tax=Levilactobacillus fujinensis TaxID=2486024 RepID=UPI0013DDC8B0|nr:hypothetical protein [Levilactobacillus fujinensis]
MNWLGGHRGSQLPPEYLPSRRTFYRAFRDKDDLLDYYDREVGQRYLTALQQITPQKMVFKEVLTYFFTFWWGNANRFVY